MAAKAKIYRKPDARLYTELDEDGGFAPPFEIQDLLSTIDTMIENGDIEDFEEGQYTAIQELLSTPTALIMERAKVILEDIVESGVQNAIDDEEETNTNDNEEETMSQSNLAKVENPNIPMTDAELTQWYAQSHIKTIKNFHQGTHAERYAMYLEYLREEERASRDLTDEEMLEELEGPEQSD